MAIDSKHPQYDARLPDWQTMRICYEGERAVKEGGVEWLPPSAGMVLDDMSSGKKGAARYDHYLRRATFYDVVEAAANALIGVMHIKPAGITLPDRLKTLIETATPEGEGLQHLLRKINFEQLLMGRVGVLMDIPDKAPAGAVPFFATYVAERILNWDDGRSEGGLQNLNMVVLDESENERLADLEWKLKTKYRLLWKGLLPSEEGDGVKPPPGAETEFRTGVFEATTMPSSEQMMAPSLAGRTLENIPFVFIGDQDLVPTPGKPPLLALALLSLSIYRQDADYKAALHMTGQETLVITGASDDMEESIRTGAGASIMVDLGGDAKYIGITSQGLPEMAKAITADKEEAARMGGRMLDNTGGERESGEALRIRVTAKTSSLASIAITGAAGLQRILRQAAVWVGANPEEVIVEPNLDFAGATMTGKELVDLVSAKTLGAPLSWQTIHEYMVERGLTERDFEAELKLIQAENDAGIGMPPVDPNAEDPEAEGEEDPEGEGTGETTPKIKGTIEFSQ